MKKMKSGIIRVLTVTCLAMLLMLVLVPVKSYAKENKKAPAYPQPPQCQITYKFPQGDYTVTPALAMTMMQTNPDGTYVIDPTTRYFVLDQAKMLNFFTGLQALFPMNTVPVAGFKTTRGDVLNIGVNLQQAGYLDVNQEILYLGNAIMTMRKENHTPITTSSGTYVEVDITNQKMYFYENGILRIGTDIVTGNASNGHNTPCGVFTVRAKQTDQNLVGADYVSHVNYWCPIYKNSIGIHDATWRKSFGGQIYLTNGSHGCINVPLNVMDQLYPILPVNTTVVVFQ